MKWLLIVPCILVSVSVSAQPAVRLRNQVTIETATVRLSDLLPGHVTRALRSAAEKIILGRAPEPGSVRLFSAAEIRSLAAQTDRLSIPGQVVVRRAGWPLQDASLQQAFERSAAASLFNVTHARLFPPPSFTTLAPDPKFEVVRIRREGAAQLLAEVRCRRCTECGRFAVRVTLLHAGARYSAPGFPGFAFDYPPATPQKLPPAVGHQVLVRRGKLALLVIEDDGIKITEPVLPEKSGALGELVRVQNLRTHIPLLAQVSGQGLLHPAPTAGQDTGER